MRTRAARWGLAIYAVFSIAALIWLTAANTTLRAYRTTSRETQITLINNTMLGAEQNLDSFLAAPVGENADRPLVNAEASLDQAGILALEYKKTNSKALPLEQVTHMYAQQIMFVREQITRTGQPGDSELQKLRDIRSDLDLLRTAIQPDVLAYGSQAEITALFTSVAPKLKIEAPKEYLLHN